MVLLHSTCSRPKKHTIDWKNRVFLDFEPHWRKRKIKEALFIDCLNPGVTMMPHTLMNLEKGIEIASCWKEFNPHIRKIPSKKYPRGKTNGKNSLNLCVKIHTYPVVWFIVDETHKGKERPLCFS